MKKGRRFFFNWSAQMLLCLVGGILAGTGTAVFLGEEILLRLEELRTLETLGRETEGFLPYWQYVFRRRFLGFAFGGLVLATPLVLWGGRFLCFGLGFWTALAISLFTLESGWQGIFLFLWSVMPQWLFYGFIWGVLIAAAPKGIEKLRLRVWLLLILGVALGSGLETL